MDNAEARRKSADIYRSVTEGKNPAVEVKRDRAVRNTRGHNIEWLIDEFIDRYFAMKKRSPRTKAEYDRALRKYCIPAWGNRPYGDITTDDIIALTHAVAESTPVMGNRLHAYLSKMFRWARSTPMRDGKGRYLQRNPVSDAIRPVDEVSRDRVLSDSEIRDIWFACDRLDNAYGPMVQMAILTGQRRNELAGMVPAELDIKKIVWSIPPERNKAKRAHDIPLSRMALRALEPRMASGTNFIFENEPGKIMSGWDRMKRRLDKTCGAKNADGDLLWSEGWTLHDTRRTIATKKRELGISSDVVEALLNHKSITATCDVQRIYDRYENFDEKREALELWAGKLTSILGLEPAENVVPLPTRAG